MIDIRIAPELWPAVMISPIVIGIYGRRLEEMTWRTHRPACVLAQMIGAMAALAVVVGASLGGPAWACYVVLTLTGWHIWRTEPAWAAAGGPPPETESRPMPFDGAHQ